MATPNYPSTRQLNCLTSFTYWESIVGPCGNKEFFILKKEKSFNTTDSFPDAC